MKFGIVALAIFVLMGTASATSFAQLGDIYTAKTDDGVTIKLLRYYPPRESANDGAQPVLLFSGAFANMNEYLTHTPPELKDLYDLELPSDLAEWARGDERIQNDPMLYYSLAYYLWKQGYDVWLVNFRGTGYGELRSEIGTLDTSIDTWALYDVRAAVRKVYEVTGKHPVIGGHSTGGMANYMFLQGCEFKRILWAEKVVYRDYLAKMRNGEIEGPETVVGFIAIDPAVGLSVPKSMNKFAIWALLDPPVYLDIRDIVD